MNSISHTYAKNLAALEKATKFAVSKMQPRHLELWHLKQMCLTDLIINRTWSHIKALPNTTKKEQKQLKSVLTRLGQMAFPDLLTGTAANPVHHNFQTVENILLILSLDGSRKYQRFKYYKKAAILALLHDIGNGFVDPSLKKLKSSDITDRRNELVRQGKTKKQIDQEINPLIRQASKYREAHMKEGAKIADKLLRKANASHNILKPTEIAEIVKLIRLHDNPSIVEYYSDSKRPYTKGKLIPLRNHLAYILREADRLWMVSKEGLEKDLFDDLRKDKQPDPFAKLRHNVKRFKDEYQLYTKANGITAYDLKGFQHETLFRTKGGFALCKQYVRKWLHDLTIECFGAEFTDP